MASRSDTFDRSDSASSLDTPSDGGSAWVVLQGTWGIASNQGYSPSAGDGDAAYLEASAADVEVQVSCPTVGNAPGVIARAADVDNWILWRYFGDDTTFKLYKKVAGSYTELGSYTATMSDGDTLKLKCSGNSLEGYVNGTLRVSATDSAGSTNTKHGLWSYLTSTARFNDFSITDLAGAGPRKALLGVGK